MRKLSYTNAKFHHDHCIKPFKILKHKIQRNIKQKQTKQIQENKKPKPSVHTSNNNNSDDTTTIANNKIQCHNIEYKFNCTDGIRDYWKAKK